MGRLTNAGAVVLSVATAYIALHFQSIMEYVQLVLSTFNAPLFALIALGILGRGRFAAGGRLGFSIGLGASVAHQFLALAGVFPYGSQMAANFYGAVFGFVVTLLAIPSAAQYHRMQSITSTERWNPPAAHPSLQPAVLIACAVLAAMFFAFNVIFW
jgi:SSS family solute:Na+ symporter